MVEFDFEEFLVAILGVNIYKNGLPKFVLVSIAIFTLNPKISNNVASFFYFYSFMFNFCNKNDDG